MFDLAMFGAGLAFMLATGNPIILIMAVVVWWLSRGPRQTIREAGRDPDAGCQSGCLTLFVVVVGGLLLAIALFGEAAVNDRLDQSHSLLRELNCSLPNDAEPGTWLHDWLERGCK